MARFEPTTTEIYPCATTVAPNHTLPCLEKYLWPKIICLLKQIHERQDFNTPIQRFEKTELNTHPTS